MALSEEGRPLTKRQKTILKAMWELGAFDKPVTTREISFATSLNLNGIAQTIGTMPFQIDCVGGRAGDTQWMLKSTFASTL